MKQTMKYLSMAALVVMGAILASCSKKEIVDPKEETPEVVDPVGPEEPAIEDNIVVCTTTVSFDTDGTKALTEHGVKTFAEGDAIVVIYKNDKGETVMAVSNSLPAGDYGNTASFEVTLTNPADNAKVRIIYPSYMAPTDVAPDVAVDDDATIRYDSLENFQDGTLEKLSKRWDLAVYDGYLEDTILPANPALHNKLAICKYTLKDSDGTSDITSSITGMTISDGTNIYRVKRSAADGPIYVAIRPTANATVTYTATNGTDYYTKTVTDKTYAASEMYQLGLRMAASKTIDLASLPLNFVAQDGDVLTGTLGGDYKISIAADATVTLSDVTINGTDEYDYKWAGLTCEGNATIILKDGTTNTVKGFFLFYPGVFVPSGSTLTIKGETLGTGSLDASSNGLGAGIGGGLSINCGNIIISGGTVTATGGQYAAGIGSGGPNGSCGAITIADTVTGVTATKGEDAPNSIGAGYSGSCGTVTIGGVVTGSISTSPYIYSNNTIVLSTIDSHRVALNGYTLTGTLGGDYKVSIADGAIVTLDNVIINGDDPVSYPWAGITCEGDATIILKGANTVKGFYAYYPGIYVPEGSTLTILGDGSLNASSNGYGAGIGGGTDINCGNIRIDGGTITAQGGELCAGIGAGGSDATSVTCGTITITGGKVTAVGCLYAAGIGSGGKMVSNSSTCGDITIASTVESVTATKGGEFAPNSIGSGYGGSCGTVTIGGEVGAISTSPYTYPSL